jgi:hypothetical protein
LHVSLHEFQTIEKCAEYFGDYTFYDCESRIYIRQNEVKYPLCPCMRITSIFATLETLFRVKSFIMYLHHTLHLSSTSIALLRRTIIWEPFDIVSLCEHMDDNSSGYRTKQSLPLYPPLSNAGTLFRIISTLVFESPPPCSLHGEKCFLLSEPVYCYIMLNIMSVFGHHVGRDVLRAQISASTTPAEIIIQHVCLCIQEEFRESE